MVCLLIKYNNDPFAECLILTNSFLLLNSDVMSKMGSFTHIRLGVNPHFEQ